MARKTGATWHPGRPHQWGKRKLQTHFILQVSQVLHLPRKVTLVRLPYVFTLSALDAAGPRRFANNVQHHTSKVLRLLRNMDINILRAARTTKDESHPIKTIQKYCACHTKNTDA
jgi:hypothetical protein